jgi:hypothetical protein
VVEGECRAVAESAATSTTETTIGVEGVEAAVHGRVGPLLRTENDIGNGMLGADCTPEVCRKCQDLAVVGQFLRLSSVTYQVLPKNINAAVSTHISNPSNS